MRSMLAAALLVGLAPLCVPAGEPEKKPDYREFSRLIHQMVVKQVPREHEEFFDWGTTIPVPEKLRLPGLRTYVKVGDRVELPHGAWKRVRVTLADPEKDVRIHVREFEAKGKQYRLVIDADVTANCDGEWKQWQKGLLLVGQHAEAVARVDATFVCDVDVAFDFSKLPPALKVSPKVSEMKVDLRDFDLIRFGGTVQGEKLQMLANDLMRDGLREFIKANESTLKDHANRAIERSLKEGKGVISADALLKAVPPAK